MVHMSRTPVDETAYQVHGGRLYPRKYEDSPATSGTS